MNRITMLCTGWVLGIAAAAGAQTSTSVAEDVRQAVNLSRAHEQALQILLRAAQHKNPFIRANVIEAMQPMPSRVLPLTQRGLADPNPVVRFAAVVTAGRLKLTKLSQAVRPLTRDDNASVRCAAVYCLHALGNPIDLTPLADYLTSRDPGVRANAAMILGLMGDASAVPMLKQTVATPMPRISAQKAAVVRMQFAEAIVRLGDDSELNTLRAGAYNQFGEVRVVAINAMGAVGDERMIPALQSLLKKEPAEVLLAAAGSLARLGNNDGRRLALGYSTAENPVHRSQAAWVLGHFQDADTLKRLSTMLEDPSVQVRVAAAASVVQRIGRMPRPGRDVPSQPGREINPPPVDR